MFATHYHELNELAERYEKIVNYRADVIETENKIIFTHKFTKGHSDHSFGIYVGRLAGLPLEVVERAKEIMKEFESTATNSNSSKLFADTSSVQIKKKKINTRSNYNHDQLSIFEIRDDSIRTKLQDIDINSITPLQALQTLQELKNMM